MVAEEYTTEGLISIWDGFLRRYKIEHRFYYFERLQQLQALGLKTLYFDYEHLSDAILNWIHVEGEDNYNILTQLVIHDTDTARDTLRQAAFRILQEVNKEYADSVERVFRAELMHAPIEKEMGDLGIEDTGKFMRTTGFVTEYDETSSSLVHSIAWLCSEGHYTQTESPNDKPTYCKVNECGSRLFRIDDRKSSIEDFIRYSVQQRSDRTPLSKSPPIREFETMGPDNVRYIKERLRFGQYVSVSGIVRTRYTRRQSGQGKSLGDIYMEACHVEPLPESYLTAEDPSYLDRVKFTIRHGSIEEEEEDVRKVVRSMFPTIHLPEDDIIKELILALLVGSDAMIQPDGTRIRGEIQLLLIGDPGIAKSRIAEYIKNARSRVMYNSAGKSSSVGLVGGMAQDKDGRWKIASGVFGLAGDGVVILDEFAGRADKDYTDLLEPMGDTQTISIAKGTHYRQETVNTAVLAIANAATFSRYYDSSKNIYDNTKIPTPNLQRFDAILIRKDMPDEKEDKAKAEHYFESAAKAVTEAEFKRGNVANIKRPGEDWYPVGYIRAWIAWLRETFHPRVTENHDAVQRIIDWYMRWRKFKITIRKDNRIESTDPGMQIPGADMRRLGSIMRLSNAHSRLCQRDFVEVRDVEWALKIIELTSAESGVWRQSESGEQIHMKDDLADAHAREARQTALRQRKNFEDVIDRLSWVKCAMCYGKGQITERGAEGPENCENCDATGWQPIAFSMNTAISECVDKKQGNGRSFMSGPAFRILWEEFRNKEILVPGNSEGIYHNTTPRLLRERGVTPMMSAEEMQRQELRDKIARLHPNRTKELKSK